MGKVFLWAGVEALVKDGRVVGVEEEEYLGEKYFEEVEYLGNNVLRLKTKGRIDVEYDFGSRRFLRIEPFEVPMGLEVALELARLFDAVSVMQANWNAIGRVSVKILAPDPLDIPVVSVDDLDAVGLDIEDPSIEEIGQHFHRLVDRALGFDSDVMIEVLLKNVSGGGRKIEILFECPDKVVVGYRDGYRWVVLPEKRFELDLDDGSRKSLYFVCLALERVHGKGKVVVKSDGNVIKKGEFTLFCY